MGGHLLAGIGQRAYRIAGRATVIEIKNLIPRRASRGPSICTVLAHTAPVSVTATIDHNCIG